ncbi:hypothetical protein Anapl_01451 [Anas platyrhynchos]|uniref:Uncharacterized protein n=1 Tax=Anas platyrhynchos TaxID=8839 RepID=R0K396_ANAPL|nr:hypothetical protein Anapl_01451 [Anas platyrhynchos]
MCGVECGLYGLNARVQGKLALSLPHRTATEGALRLEHVLLLQALTPLLAMVLLPAPGRYKSQASGSCSKLALRSCLCLVPKLSPDYLQFSWIFPNAFPAAAAASGVELRKYS